MNLFLKIYDRLAAHKRLMWLMLCIIIALLVVCVFRMNYKEDITDFLPLTEQQKQQTEIYQSLEQADRIIIIFEKADSCVSTDELLNAVDLYESYYSLTDIPLVSRIDIGRYVDHIHWITENIAYFLTDADYQRIDSLLTDKNYVSRQLARDKAMLQTPLSGMMQQMLQDDPLQLYSPIIRQLQQFQPVVGGFTSMDDYMLTADERMALAYLQSPYGSAETKQNSVLINSLQQIADSVNSSGMSVGVRLIGAPVIATQNASQIKKDSVLAICLSVVLILALLLHSFWRDKRSILLILLTISFGWLFGMALTSLIRSQISVIVLGICSVIIGIAVNYPLHVLFHRRYCQSVRQTLKEVLQPLIIGNITTVAAFLALIPLRATALRDLGIFAAAMLVGTILFSVLFLPQMMKKGENEFNASKTQESEQTKSVIGKQSKIRLSQYPALRYSLLAVITVISGLMWYAGKDIEFDTNLSHINYLTEQQKADFAFFAGKKAGESRTNTDIYIVQPWSEAVSIPLCREAIRWLPNKERQQERIDYYANFWQSHAAVVSHQLTEAARKEGFRDGVFGVFLSSISSATYEVHDFDFFEDFARSMLPAYYLKTDTAVQIVSYLNCENEQLTATEDRLQQQLGERATVFDIPALQSSMARTLSDNFDYIGLVCSVVVFLFLLVSFRSLRLALIAFMPMAVSWIWILGLMHIFSLQFNVVNVILATFIFGQGDDYTIFVVEALQHERQTGERLLPQFRYSIILSALIMFAGIGVLAIARHPAMYSLGVVTLIGMGVVVLLANLLPPLLFPSGKRKKFCHINKKA